jgi:hypothetical protein
VKPVHFSRLKLMSKSPQHYAAADTIPPQDTPAMRLGRLVHFLVLGGPHVVYGGRRAGVEWNEFEAAHPGIEIFTATEADVARPIADAVLCDLDAGPLLVGERELPVEWTMAGRSCAGRVDVLGSDFICDLKTAADAAPERFTRQALRMGYHAQLDWYGNGVELAGLGRKPARFIVAVETKPPHVVQCYEFTDAALEQGRRLWWTWWERLLACERSNNWPGYANGIFPIDAEDELIFGEEAA